MKVFSLMLVALVLMGSASADLVYHFEFEGNANDSSVNSYNGTEVGTVNYVPGAVGMAADLPAGSNYIEAPAAAWPIGPEITIAYCVNQRDLSGSVYHFQGTDFEDASGTDWGITGTTWQDGLYWDVQSGGDRASASGMQENTWYHIALTHNTTTDSQKVYLNGSLIVDNTGLTQTTDGVDLLYIGHMFGLWDGSPAWDGNLDGLIDDFRIYDNELTQTEIKALVPPIIPEPASLILLGLGGMLIRKKK